MVQLFAWPETKERISQLFVLQCGRAAQSGYFAQPGELQSQHLSGRGKQVSEFKASLLYRVPENQKKKKGKKKIVFASLRVEPSRACQL